MKKEQEKLLSKIESEIIDKYGEVILSIDSLKENRGRAIPITLSLDIATNGGFLEGTIMSLSGVSGSGKTTLTLEIIANAQAMDKPCFYIDAENRLQPELLSTIVRLDPKKLTIIRSAPGSPLTAEKVLNIIEKIIGSIPHALIVLDSVAALSTEADYTAEHGETTRRTGLQTMLYASLRKIAQMIAAMKSNIIFITHVQANPSGYGGPNEMGGNAIKYNASYRLQCLSSQEVPKNEEKKQGRESTFKVLKSALGPGTGSATLYIKYNKGYDRCKDIVQLAMDLDLIQRKGAWYTIVGHEDLKLQGEASVVETLENNESLRKEISEKIRSMSLSL